VGKFVDRVHQVSFSARHSREIGQEVLYVTERAVFRLVEKTLELIEVAPGIDIEKQVLGLMSFEPVVRSIRPMAGRLFASPGG
jgi:propionate CoA-transferase